MNDIGDYLGKDVIFQYLRERRDGRKNARVGILMALKHKGEVYIGFSKCHEKEKFNLLDGLKMAEFRAIDESNPEIPIKHAREIANFVSRSKRYFKGVSVFHYPRVINCRNENKIPENVSENTYTECKDGISLRELGMYLKAKKCSKREAQNTYTECKEDINDMWNSKSGKESRERARKIFEERRERVKRTGEKDLMPEMLDSIMEEIANEENTYTECSCKCGDKLAYTTNKGLELNRVKRELEKTHTESCRCIDREPDIVKVLDDSFRDVQNDMERKVKLAENALKDMDDMGEKLNGIDYSKGYFTNAHMKDLNKRLKELEESNVIKGNWLGSINKSISKLIELISRVEKLEVMHKVKAEDVKAEGFIDYAYVIRHNGKVNNTWDMPLSDYANKYLVDEVEGIYSDDLDKAIKYVSFLTARDAIEEEGMDGYEEVVRVKRVGDKWIYWMVADGSW